MKEKTKLCIIPESGVLPIRDGIHGPIHNPSEFTLKEIVTLITNGIKIYEVNPYNKKKQVLLTFQNANAENFPKRKRAKIISSHQQSPVKIQGNNSKVKYATSFENTTTVIKQNKGTTDKVSKPDFF